MTIVELSRFGGSHAEGMKFHGAFGFFNHLSGIQARDHGNRARLPIAPALARECDSTFFRNYLGKGAALATEGKGNIYRKPW